MTFSVPIEIHDPNNEIPIHEMWAFLSIDEDGNEGIVAVPLPLGGSMSMVTGKESNLPAMESLAKMVAEVTKTKKTIQLVKFSKKEVLRLIA